MAAKRAIKATGALYNVRLFDPEVGSFRHYARMRGTSKADVTRRFLAKWAMSDDLGPSKDDISVVKATPRKKARTVPNPAKRSASTDAFTIAYIEAALWSSTDDDGDPLDRNYSDSDIAGSTLLKMKRDCAKFQRENARDLESGSSSQGGHDFWLTRNRHGAGFWETSDWPKDEGRRLTDASHRFGEVDLYIGDDGKIHAGNAGKRTVGKKRAAGAKTASRRKVPSKRVANPAKRRAAKKRGR